MKGGLHLTDLQNMWMLKNYGPKHSKHLIIFLYYYAGWSENRRSIGINTKANYLILERSLILLSVILHYFSNNINVFMN